MIDYSSLTDDLLKEIDYKLIKTDFNDAICLSELSFDDNLFKSVVVKLILCKKNNNFTKTDAELRIKVIALKGKSEGVFKFLSLSDLKFELKKIKKNQSDLKQNIIEHFQGFDYPRRIH